VVLAARPSDGRGAPPAAQLPIAPALLANAPDVPWDDAARRVLAGLAAEADGADYLGTCHLLLALTRHCPEATGVGYDAARSAAGGPAAASGAASARWSHDGERWPTPRLRQAVARAATAAQIDGGPVSPRDLWQALQTDPDAECRAVLDALGVPAVDGVRARVGG
jgi:hypothetical protein